MFAFSMHKHMGLYVGIFSGTFISDHDYQCTLDSLVEIDQAAKNTARGLAVILVNGDEVPPVPVRWRVRMSAYNESVQSQHCYMSIVTASTLMRGVLTAINWLSPKREGHERQAHSTFEEGRIWVEKKRQERLPEFDTLYLEARTRLLVNASNHTQRA